MPLKYNFSIISTANTNILEYSPEYNKDYENLKVKYSIDLQMFKSYLVNKTIEKIFLKYMYGLQFQNQYSV